MKRVLGRAVILWCLFKLFVTILVIAGIYFAADGKAPQILAPFEKVLGSKATELIHRYVVKKAPEQREELTS